MLNETSKSGKLCRHPQKARRLLGGDVWCMECGALFRAHGIGHNWTSTGAWLYPISYIRAKGLSKHPYQRKRSINTVNTPYA